MRACVLTATGANASYNLEITDVPDAPAPQAGEVRVSIRAAALNHLDLFVREGLPGLTLPLPFWTGCDIAGDVAQVGAAVGTSRWALASR